MLPYAPRPRPFLRPSSSLRRLVQLAGCRCVRRCQLISRIISTSVPSRNPSGGQKQNETETDLQRIRSSLESATRLRVQATPDSVSLLEPLAGACDTLTKVDVRRDIRVSVYSEEDAPARDLTTLLLEDPLSSDSSFRSAIQERWTSQDVERRNILRFRQPGAESSEEGSVAILSPFLSGFSSVKLEELRPDASIAHLFKADIPIVVASPLHTPSPSLLTSLSGNPHALLVIDGAFDSSSPSVDRLRAQIADKYRCNPERVSLVDTARALRGSSFLTADPSSPSSVRAFQEDMLASGIPDLLRVLSETVALGPNRLRSNTQDLLKRRVVKAVKDVICHAKEEVREVRSRSSALHEEALEALERAEMEILGGETEVVDQDERGRVIKGMERVKTDLKQVLDRLAWYRLPFVVDDVSDMVDASVERAFAKEFENELLFHTGRLAFLQRHFGARTASLLSSLPPSLQSVVLQNHLAQISSSPSFPITPSSPSPLASQAPTNPLPRPPALLAPLRKRTAQLAYATRALHLTAQRLLLFTYAHGTLSCLSSTLLYVHISIDGGTSIGIGSLSALVGLRWAVGRWARAKARWWASFRRVGDGLGRDMSATLKSVLETQVCVLPIEACTSEGLQGVVERRERQIGEVEGEVEGLEARVDESEEEVEDGRTNGEGRRESKARS